MTDPVLAVRGLRRWFPITRGLLRRHVGDVKAVDGIDLELAPGETVGLVGESGCGKSTAGRTMLRLLEPTAGTVELDGRDITHLRRAQLVPLRRTMQMIFQDPYSSLDPRLRVGESIAEALLDQRLSGSARTREIERWLEAVGLDPATAAVRPKQLSGGQCQRVAIARALAARPGLLIADEITSALDVSVQGAILNLVREMQRELGFTLVFISHNLALVRYLSTSVAVMYAGQVVELGAAREVTSEPTHPYTQALLAAVPRLGATVGSSGVFSDADVVDPHHPPGGCRFHPRCPVGPRADDERTVCAEADPREGAEQRQHRAACFFASELVSR